jgi:hypothetical protein
MNARHIIRSDVLGMRDAKELQGDRECVRWTEFGEWAFKEGTVGLPPDAHSSCGVLGRIGR